MVKYSASSVLLAVWLAFCLPAQAQYRYSPVGAARMPEPMPVRQPASGPPAPPPNLVQGPLTPEMAPQGPSADLSLPSDHFGAYEAEEIEGPNWALLPPLTGVWVDLYSYQPHFSSSPAFRFNGREVNFTYPKDFFPELKINIQFTEDWGLRGSLYKTGVEARSIGLVNNNPTPGLITSEQPFAGIAVTSAENYRFLPRTPTFTQFDTPPRRLPPFPFRNSILFGSPDSLLFDSAYQFQSGDMEATRVIEIGDARGVMGFGVQYSRYKQRYIATRVNPGGGPRFIPGYDPFINIDDDASLTVFQDFSIMDYSYQFGGVGPKLSMELGLPFGDRFTLFAKVRGTVLMGSRTERLNYAARQFVRISDIDRNPEADLDFDEPILFSTDRSSFTVVPMAETEIGVNVRLGHAVVFPEFRLSYRAQYWLGIGNGTGTTANYSTQGINATLGFGF